MNAFEDVRVESSFRHESGGLKRRCFHYSIDGDGVSDLQDVEADDQLASSSATVKLIGLKATFQDEWPKKPLTVVARAS